MSLRCHLVPVIVLRLALVHAAGGATGCSWFEVDEPTGGSDAAPPGGAGHIQVTALAAGDEFGTSVAAAPDRIAVGAPGDDRQGSESGAVHFFSPASGGGGWSEDGVLVGDDGRTGDRFGTSVALAGDLLAVGAPGRDESGSYAGAVYLYRRDGASWRRTAVLIAPDGRTGDRFGTSAAFLDPDRLAVGASGQDTDQPGAGATYLFQRDGEDWMPLR